VCFDANKVNDDREKELPMSSTRNVTVRRSLRTLPAVVALAIGSVTFGLAGGIASASASGPSTPPPGVQESPATLATGTWPVIADPDPAAGNGPNVPINAANVMSPLNQFGNCTSGHYCFWRDINWDGGTAQWYGPTSSLSGYTYEDCSGSCSEDESASADYNYNVYDYVDTYDGSGNFMFCDSVGYGVDNLGSYSDRMHSFTFGGTASCP
jgi:hypothetical protein